MTDYHLIKLKLTKGQITRCRSALRHGKSLTLRVKAIHMGVGDTHISLSPTQIEVAAKKHKAGLGAQFTISHAALQHSQSHGSGLGSWLKDKAKQVAAYGIRAGGNALADYVGGKGIKKRKVTKGKGFFKNIAGAAVKGLGNLVGNAIQGSGIKRKRKTKAGKCEHCGHGFMSNLAGGAVKGIGNLIGNAIQGSGIGKPSYPARRIVLGKGFLAPGY